jgi:hypothetical protein
MARPRVFVSSTFYDLRQIRADLEQFIRSMGYEPVLHERGSIAYSSAEKLEEACYREVQLCDMMVSVIGGRFGTTSQKEPYSISQLELKTALQLGMQVYVFVDQSVLNEYQTYLKNKEVPGFACVSVDNINVYKFIEEVHALPPNNPITAFQTVQDIVAFLREQWAGLFQNFLQERSRQPERRILEDMQSTAKTLNQLVEYLTAESRAKDKGIQEILLVNHPAFDRLRKVTRNGYRLFFTNYSEFAEWATIRGYARSDENDWEDSEHEEWLGQTKSAKLILRINTKLFDENGRLVPITPTNWDDNWITQKVLIPRTSDSDEDLPF